MNNFNQPNNIPKSFWLFGSTVIILGLGIGIWLGTRPDGDWKIIERVPAEGGHIVLLELGRGNERIVIRMSDESLASQRPSPRPGTDSDLSLPEPDEQMVIQGQSVGLYIPDCLSDYSLQASFFSEQGILYSALASGYCFDPATARQAVFEVSNSYQL